jgi:ribosomal protein L29
MKAAGLREQTDDELRQHYEDTARELSDLRLKKGAGDSSEQPLKIRAVRRDMARILTVMQERDRAAGRGGRKHE